MKKQDDSFVEFDDKPSDNHLLAELPARELKELSSVMEPFELNLREVLYRSGEEIRHVYFPTRGVISIVVAMANGSCAEAGMVGREGMLGLWVVLGAKTSPVEAVVQGPGKAFRVTVEDFAAKTARCRSLPNRLLRYADAFLAMVSQSAACNRLHSVEQRFCRWLLMTRDRTETDDFLMTQEFLGRMLGIRRMSITPTAQRLQKSGLIRYSRGRIRILDRLSLEREACECYRVVRSRFESLFPPS